ncbi:MAG: hypothetical protein ACYC7D_06760 [Nitrososphaerales archaeon]
MPRIGNLELSSAHLALRIIIGLILGALVLILFYYVPAHLTALLSPYVPQKYLPDIAQFVSILESPGIPFLGVLLAIVVFFDVLLKGSWIYGIALVLTGILFLSYDILLFEGGQFFQGLFPQQVTESSFYQQFSSYLILLVILLIIPTVLSIVRGFLLIARRNSPRKQGMSIG